MAKGRPDGPQDDIDFAAYSNHLRRHTDEERGKLEAEITADGCNDALVVGILNGKRYLVDGFHRKEICDRLGVPYGTRERAFDSEEELLKWIERNARARRNQTRTERNYYIGLRYLREKKSEGAPTGNQRASKTTGKKVASCCPTAQRIATEERCSHQHVKNCAKMASHVALACSSGLGFLRDLILSERIKYSKKLLDELIYQGAGGCEEVIRGLLAESPDKPLSPRAIFKALGGEDAPADDEPQLTDVARQVEKYASKARTPRQLAELVGSLRAMANRYEKQLRQMQEDSNGHDAAAAAARSAPGSAQDELVADPG